MVVGWGRVLKESLCFEGNSPVLYNFVAHTLVMVEKILEEVQGSEAKCCKCFSGGFFFLHLESHVTYTEGNSGSCWVLNWFRSLVLRRLFVV